MFADNEYDTAIERHVAHLAANGIKPPTGWTAAEAGRWLRCEAFEDYMERYRSIDRHRDDLLFFMATQDRGDFAYEILTCLRDEDWETWDAGRKTVWSQLLETHWRAQFEYPIVLCRAPSTDNQEDIVCQKIESWEESYASRFFELADGLNLVSADFLSPLFSAGENPERFLLDCLFVQAFSAEFHKPTTDWAGYLPDRDFVRQYLADGFFAFEQLQQEASAAEWNLADLV